MFIYFDRNGVLQEVINDKAARLGDLNANEIYVYVDEVELDDIWLTLKRPDGTLSVEKSFIANKVVREIPYDPKRDMKFFKDYKEYEFYKFTISDEITIAGVYQATIRMTYEDTLSALGVLVFKAETGVIKSDQNITQAQYDYLIWYVGSWQGQIGDLEEAMGIAQADILGLKNRMNVAEQDINKIEDGTTVVNKALKDDLGNTIKSTYIKDIFPTFTPGQNALYINWFVGSGGAPKDKYVVLPKATPSADGLLSKEDKVKIDNIASDIASMGATKQSLSEKNQINGYAGLDANAKIPSSLLPDSVLGQLEYKGTFTPTAYPSSPEKGWFYISIGNGVINGVDFQVGDWAVFNGSTWDKVDNTDAVMSVNGKLGVVVLNGTDIKVGNGDTWTIEQRIVNIYAELNNRYTKAQTYSQNEIEQRLTDLIGMANLQDMLIGSYTNGQTVSASDLSPYNFVIVLGKDLDNTYTATFKPSEIVSGNIISLSPTVYLTRGATDFTITTPTSVKLWGLKLDGITADEIGYDGTISGLSSTNVKTAIDELASEKADKTYVDSQDLLKADKLVLTNYAKNGNMSSTTDYGVYGGTLSANANILTLTGGNVTSSPSARQDTNAVLSNGIKLYITIKVKHTNKQPTAFEMSAYGSSPLVLIKTMAVSNPTLNSEYFMSMIAEPTTQTTNVRVLLNPQYIDITTAENSTTQFRELIVVNLTEIFGAGKEPTKEQMDRIIQAKGFFQTTDITIKDLFNDKADKLVLTNLVTNGDLLTPKASPNENEPLGFIYSNSTDITLINGIAKFTATARWGRLQQNIIVNSGDIIYYFANFKSNSPLVTLIGVVNISQANTYHSGSGNFEFKSNLQTASGSFNSIQISDTRTTDWTEVEVDYVGAINLTATFGAGNEPTKEQMDDLLKRMGYFQEEEINWFDFLNTQVYKEVAWSELVNLRNTNSLFAGSKYRITDYITTTTQENTQSANNPFDIIVEALSSNTLSENASAIQSARDTSGYFANAKLSAWKIKYSLDNDTTRFVWADETNGKGVIYEMIDEWNNKVPYDFKNIKFIRKLTAGVLDSASGTDTYVYTFNLWDGTSILDASNFERTLTESYTKNYCTNNIIKPKYKKFTGGGPGDTSVMFDKQYELNDIVLLNRYANLSGALGYHIGKSNFFDDNCYSITLGAACNFNRFDKYCYNNILGDYSKYNTFGNYCYYNTFGNSCYSNTFGNSCYYNTFGNSCYYNTFGNYCYSNTFGNSCYYNTFGNSCYYNTFGNYCYYNTFGNSCYYNTFGANCYSNTFGNSCSSNTFGNNCSSNTFGNYCYYNKITGDSVRYISVDSGLKGASFANQLELYDSEIVNKAYQISFKQSASGRYLMLWATDNGTMTGKYKTTNTDATWTAL